MRAIVTVATLLTAIGLAGCGGSAPVNRYVKATRALASRMHVRVASIRCDTPHDQGVNCTLKTRSGDTYTCVASLVGKRGSDGACFTYGKP